MSGGTPPLSPEEEALRNFLAPLPEATAVRLRTLAHAWSTAGGRLHVGKLCIRLLARQGKPFTAGTLHAGGRLELSRVLLHAHGVPEPAWTEWCDEYAYLATAGFDGGAKYPSVTLGKLHDAHVARLALGLRDLALALHGDRAG